MFVGAVFAWYLLTNKPLSELPGLTKEKVPQYAFSIYGITRPIGVAVSPSGERIYVTESEGTRQVQIYDRAGKKIGSLQPPQSATASYVPVYVAIDPITGNVFVSDRPTQSVYVYNAAGVYLNTFATGAYLGGGWQPLGLAFDKERNLYVTDVSGPSHRIVVFKFDGTVLRTLGVTDKLLFPNGIAVDSEKNIYVSDSNNGRMVVYNPVGKIFATINRGAGLGDLGLPRGAAIDDRNRLYVADTAAQIVKIYLIEPKKSAIPRYIGSFGEEGQLDGQFQFPNGVATDAYARIYVTDRENNRVQVWRY